MWSVHAASDQGIGRRSDGHRAEPRSRDQLPNRFGLLVKLCCLDDSSTILHEYDMKATLWQ